MLGPVLVALLAVLVAGCGASSPTGLSAPEPSAARTTASETEGPPLAQPDAWLEVGFGSGLEGMLRLQAGEVASITLPDGEHATGYSARLAFPADYDLANARINVMPGTWRAVTDSDQTNHDPAGRQLILFALRPEGRPTPGTITVVVDGVKPPGGTSTALRYSLRTAVPTDCMSLYYQLPTSERMQCKTLLWQREMDAMATANAQPRPTLAAPTYLTPTPPPPGYVDPRVFGGIRERPAGSMAGVSNFPKPVSSIWDIGAFSRGWDTALLVLYARPPKDEYPGRPPVNWALEPAPVLGVYVFGNVPSEDVRRYTRVWRCPREVGSMKIISVEGPTVGEDGPMGIVHFTASSGVTGTFDMATEAWTFDK